MRKLSVIKAVAEHNDAVAVSLGQRSEFAPPSWAQKQTHYAALDSRGGVHCFVYGVPVSRPAEPPGVWVRWIDAVPVLDPHDRMLDAHWSIRSLPRHLAVYGDPRPPMFARVPDRLHAVRGCIHLALWRNMLALLRSDLVEEGNAIIREMLAQFEADPPKKHARPGRPSKPKGPYRAPGNHRQRFYPDPGEPLIPPDITMPPRGK